MAFFCPVRIRRNKKKNASLSSLDKVESQLQLGGSAGGLALGRITGSASIETLVRVGIEKEHGLAPDSKMLVLHDFTPCVDDELEVKRRQVVNVLYRENDWVYVISMETKQEGFIPYSYCVPYNDQMADFLTRKKVPRENETADNVNLKCNKSSDNNLDSNFSFIDCDTEITPFYKDPMGSFVVLYTFIARDENDLSVERGELVTVLNKEDPDWYWVVRSDNQEGFIPSAFVLPVDEICEKGDTDQDLEKACAKANQTLNVNETNYQGTEFIMLYDYKAQAPDDLSVKRGEWIYADVTNQNVEGWLWSFSPKSRKYGFIPKAYARIPAMTSL